MLPKPQKLISHGVHVDKSFTKPKIHACEGEQKCNPAPKIKKSENQQKTRRELHLEQKKKTKHQQYAEERDFKKLPRIPESK